MLKIPNAANYDKFIQAFLLGHKVTYKSSAYNFRQTVTDLMPFENPGQCKDFKIEPWTLNINGFEVPYPVQALSEIPSGQTLLYIPHLNHSDFYTYISLGNNRSEVERHIKAGVGHIKKENAAIHGKALRSFFDPELKPDES